MLASDYVLRLPELDDDTILATDEAGAELLHFAVHWSDKIVRIHYPRFGQWQKFCESVYTILTQIGTSIDQIDVDHVQTDREEWQDLCGRFLFLHDIYPKIVTTFFSYLRPIVDGMDEAQSEHWLRDNAPLDAVVRMFCALLTPQLMLKKNARFALRAIFQASTDQPSMPSFMSNGGGQKSESTTPQPSLFGSFY